MIRAKLTLAAIGTFALAACGGSSGSSDTPQAEQITSPAATESVEARTEASITQQAAPATPGATPDTVLESEAAVTPEFASLPAPYNTADYAVGKRTFKLCASCHFTKEGVGHQLGPNLYGLFSRGVGEAEGFDYSDALLEADFQWTGEKMNEWLENPRTFLAGNRMSFSGVRKPSHRIAVTAYLMSETGYVAPEE